MLHKTMIVMVLEMTRNNVIIFYTSSAQTQQNVVQKFHVQITCCMSYEDGYLWKSFEAKF